MLLNFYWYFDFHQFLSALYFRLSFPLLHALTILKSCKKKRQNEFIPKKKKKSQEILKKIKKERKIMKHVFHFPGLKISFHILLLTTQVKKCLQLIYMQEHGGNLFHLSLVKLILTYLTLV